MTSSSYTAVSSVGDGAGDLCSEKIGQPGSSVIQETSLTSLHPYLPSFLTMLYYVSIIPVLVSFLEFG